MYLTASKESFEEKMVALNMYLTSRENSYDFGESSNFPCDYCRLDGFGGCDHVSMKWNDSLLFWKFDHLFSPKWESNFCPFTPRQLIISQSQITSLWQFLSLKGLCIHRSSFTSDIYELLNLEMLTLNNIIGDKRILILDKLRNLKKLRYLNLAENDFEILPEWISELPLVTLIITKNQLKELPSRLPVTLIALDVSVNLIKRLPLNLSLLERLKYFSWERNPIQFPPQKILSTGIKSTMNYLKEFLTDTIPNDTIKLLFVGRKRSGKTTLMHALNALNGKVSNPKTIAKTDGVDIKVKKMKDVKFKMFDLAGDDNYLETHTIFLSDDALYLAIFNVQLYGIYSKKHDVVTRIEMWLSAIYARARNARVIIVATHVDTPIASNEFLEEIWNKLHTIFMKSKGKHLADFGTNSVEGCLICHSGDLKRQKDGKVVVNSDINSKSFEETFGHFSGIHNFPHVVGYFEVSSVKQIPRKWYSSQNESIVQLREHIVSVSHDMLSINPKIPKKWDCAWEILESLCTENQIISYSFLLEKIKGTEISEKRFDLFLKHYTSKGDLIYFDKLNRNENFIVLSPQWLSDQLCHIITYKNIPEITEGIISHVHLSKILKGKNFKQILHLFRDTSTFIPFDENNELIPFLLPIATPTHHAWPLAHTDNQVNFVFQFDFLPPEFFSHIMAAIHRNYSKFPIGKMKPVYYYNNIVFDTNHFEKKCNLHENLLNTDETSLHHRVRFELLPHLEQIKLSVIGKHPCCMAINLLLLVTDLHERLCPNVRIQKRHLCGVCVEEKVQKPSSFDISTEESGDPIPICEMGHKLQSWHNLKVGKLESRGTLTKTAIETIVYSITDMSCPKLFMMIPVNVRSLGWGQFLVSTFISEGYAVHLICECPGAWHFLSTPGYFLKSPKSFVKKYGPRLQVLLKLLSMTKGPLNLVVRNPVGNAMGQLGKLAEVLEKCLDDFKDDFKFTENLSYEASLKYLSCNDGLNKRELHRFLNTLESKGRFGDLIPVLVGDEILWLCEKHARYYLKAV